MPLKPRLVLINWGDAHFTKTDPLDCKPIECWDVGFVVEESKTAWKLARAYSPEDKSYRFFMTIPKRMVQAVKTLRYSPR